MIDAKQYSFVYIRGDYSPASLPGPHDIDLTFDTRKEAEGQLLACVEELRTRFGSKTASRDDYLIVERDVPGWKASVS